MANSRELYVDPEGVKSMAYKYHNIAEKMNNTLLNVTAEIQNTDDYYQAKSADEMRKNYNEVKNSLGKFVNYLDKVAAYLKQSVSEPADIVDEVAVSNAASIKKPL